jgi:CRP/FNR family transcriptional regulator, cyclic AMP receptor protein
MLLTIEKIIYLNNVDLFKSMQAKDLHLVAQITKEEFFKKSDLVIKEGDVGDKMFIIYDGEVEIYKGGHGGPSKIHIMNKGNNDFFGEMNLLGAETRSASAVCNVDTRCLTIAKEDLTELIYEYPGLSFGIMKGLVNNLIGSTGRYFALKAELEKEKQKVDKPG